jgi:pimeloyl-ACP methyl ester carboxylesterase
MHRLERRAAPGTTAGTCIVCRPGAYDRAADFLSAGFDAAVAARGLPVDLLLVDAEPAHLEDRRWREHLKHDLVLPARAAGCRCLWFAGISLGGFMALDYAAANPGDLDGLCLLAPYLGNRMLLREIAAAPGLPAWQAGPLADADEERRIWRFIQAQPEGSRLLYLGYGREDRFAPAHRLLAQTLPAAAVDVVPGGHDWPTWKILWENFLQSTFP